MAIKGHGQKNIPFIYCFLLRALFFSLFLSFAKTALADDLRLPDLIDEALKNNHDILLSEARWKTSSFRVPQVQSLPDPMFMFGYQNEGLNRYTYGEMQGAQWMFSASQMFPYPGKRALKGEMAEKESEGLMTSTDSVRRQVVVRVRELYLDLFLAYKNIDLLHDKSTLFSKIEDAAVARYSTGMGLQQEVLMAQTEKYMLLEKEEMQKQKIQSVEAMLNLTLGRDINSPLGRPVEPMSAPYSRGMDDIIRAAYDNSPEIKTKEKMIAAAEARVKMAKKEYYPDFTVNASYYKRRWEFQDMWSLTTTINVPIFYKTKQRQAVLEAESILSETQHELESTKLMISSAIRDNYSMHNTAGRLMDLYKTALIPKTYQDFDSSLAGYTTGKLEAMTVINKLKSLIDFELLYWGQLVEREKAIARFEAIAGLDDGHISGQDMKSRVEGNK